MMAAQELMRHGALVPDSTVWEMVRERSDCLRCSGGFLLDGFPRTLGQAEALNVLMHEEKLSLHAVVDYELPLTEIVSRLSSRRTCQKCESVFTIPREPSKARHLCDRCGGTLFQREDDNPEAVTVRLKVYERDTAPLILYYRHLGLLLPVDATGSPEEVCARTLNALHHRFQPTA
jgi:adenylate kinase